MFEREEPPTERIADRRKGKLLNIRRLLEAWDSVLRGVTSRQTARTISLFSAFHFPREGPKFPNNYRQVTPIRMAMDQIEIEEQGEENKQESGRRENAQTWIIKSEGRHGRGTVNAESASEGESVRRVSFFENGTPTKDPVRHSEAESGGCTCS